MNNEIKPVTKKMMLKYCFYEMADVIKKDISIILISTFITTVIFYAFGWGFGEFLPAFILSLFIGCLFKYIRDSH
jgi:type III secretory pathway component EscR